MTVLARPLQNCLSEVPVNFTVDQHFSYLSAANSATPCSIIIDVLVCYQSLVLFECIFVHFVHQPSGTNF